MSEQNKSSGKTKSKSWFSFFKKNEKTSSTSTPSKSKPSPATPKSSSSESDPNRNWGPGRGSSYRDAELGQKESSSKEKPKQQSRPERGPRPQGESPQARSEGEGGQRRRRRGGRGRNRNREGGPDRGVNPDRVGIPNAHFPELKKAEATNVENDREDDVVATPVSLEDLEGFAELGLIEPLQLAVAKLGYTSPTPIQQQSIPHLLQGHDLLGNAQTGTGKTAAFALPILQRLFENPRRPEPRRFRVLVLSPTRELALQIQQSFVDYGKNLNLSSAVIFGGVGQGPQVAALKRGLDILVATPGRFLDLMEQKHLELQGLEVFVLDEADRMLDMGFIHDIKKIIKVLPAERQNLFFSATMAGEINKLASSFLRNPVRVAVNPVSSTAELIDQKVIFVEKAHKRELLRYVLQNPELAKVIVFTRTKHGANQVSEMLEKNGFSSAAIHGNKSQNARQKALESFRAGQVRVLVATDIAARGIDIDEITHVVNFELPNVPEDYVHRIGRTARAGAKGQAIAFCNPEERVDLKNIERLTGRPLEVTEYPDFKPSAVSSPSSSGELRHGGGSRGGNRGGRGGGSRGGGGGRRGGGGRGRR